MKMDKDLILKELSLNLRAALDSGEDELAKEINKTIDRLIKYCIGGS
jgi:hypothetical protein